MLTTLFQVSRETATVAVLESHQSAALASVDSVCIYYMTRSLRLPAALLYCYYSSSSWPWLVVCVLCMSHVRVLLLSMHHPAPLTTQGGLALSLVILLSAGFLTLFREYKNEFRQIVDLFDIYISWPRTIYR
jgi:hypothetical protein